MNFVLDASVTMAWLPLATLDADLAKAARKAGVKRFTHSQASDSVVPFDHCRSCTLQQDRH